MTTNSINEVSQMTPQIAMSAQLFPNAGMQNQTRNYQLDALRGLAALTVVVYHLGWFYGVPNIASGGYLAVDFFFALSGMVIASAYNDRLASGLSTFRFLAMRIVRLYPIFFLGLVLGLVKSVAQMHFQQAEALTQTRLLEALVLNLFMLPVPFNYPVLFPLNSPLWSLFLEILINVIYGFVLFKIKNNLLIALMLLGAAGLIVAVFLHPLIGLEVGNARSTVIFGVARVVFGFSLGMLLARILTVCRKASLSVPLFLAVVVMLFLFAPTPAFLRPFRDLGFTFVGVPLILHIGARFDLPARWRSSAKILGDLSYPIYGLHYPLMLAFCFILARAKVNPLIAGPTVLAIIIGSAYLGERLFDRPIRKWLSHKLGLRESAPPQII